jgi:hypothetical protein
MKIIELALLSIALIGCGYSESKLIKEGEYEARDQKHDQFIKLKDGKILTFGELKFKEKLVGSESHFEADGKKLNINYDDILEFQTEKYCVYNSESAGFLYKIRSGKIELFVASTIVRNAFNPSVVGQNNTTAMERSNNASAMDRSFSVRKGANGQILPLNKSILKSMIADKKEVLEEFDSKYRIRYFLRNVMEIIDDYN